VEGVGADILLISCLESSQILGRICNTKKRSHCKLKPTKEEFDDPAVLLHICQLRVANV